MGRVSWPLYVFVFLASFSAFWWPNISPKMGFPELFEKTIGSIRFIPGIYPNGMSLLTPIYFCVPSSIFGPLVAKYLAEKGVSKRPNIWQKMGFLKLSEKIINSIHFILDIYPCGVSLLMTIHFPVPSFIFGPLVAKYLAEIGVPETFW